MSAPQKEHKASEFKTLSKLKILLMSAPSKEHKAQT